MQLIDLAETGLLPDALLRLGIRYLLARRRSSLGPGALAAEVRAFTEQLRTSPLAVATDEANRQHYEVPADFFRLVLGPRLKYSCCFFETPDESLAEAECEMLRRTCARAELEDGQRVLDLGCGWGSLALWIAENYPNSETLALSNSASQRAFIEARVRQRGLGNVRVVTADLRKFASDERFDRVVSVEMFEHMRNYELLLRRVASWLTPEGKAFVHIFCHRDTPYLFETEGAANWMGRNFFTGGMMPSEDLFHHFRDDLAVEEQWRINGLHYWRTCEAWLDNLDRNRAAILARFGQDLAAGEARRRLQQWRMFFMACAELFRYRGGEEWFVAHYRFRRNPSRAAVAAPPPANCTSAPAEQAL